MNRHRADRVVGLLLAGVLLGGGLLTWQAYQQQRTVDGMGSMMGTSMGAAHGTNPIWYVLGTLLVSAVVGGLYLTVRDELVEAGGNDRPPTEQASAAAPEPDEQASAVAPEPGKPADGVENDAGATTPEAQPRARVLDLLPEDERRVLEPVLSSPGITQIELRDRSDFSKSKVSQTVSDLEKRGLLYRERQGRTYRIYPSDDLRQNQDHSSSR